MSLVKWNPVNTFDIIRDFDSVISEFFNRPPGLYRDREPVMTPHIDVVENENSYELRAELPGVDKKDVEISVKDNILTISGEKKQDKEQEGENCYCCERSFGKFERSFRMSDAIDEKNISAKYKDGVLIITVPAIVKIEDTVRKIDIK